ncbi:MAG: response regulator transcription factor [Anaerolineae bacterium]
MESRSILVIDDDPLCLDLVHYTLSRAGWQVYLAASGTDGLQQFNLYLPDLVILDILMPGLNGWETCGRIREFSSVPIIILTGLDQKHHVVRALRESRADDYLIKPLSSDILVARIESLLRRVALSSPLTKAMAYEDEYLAINLAERAVLVQGQRVKLTVTEYRLLIYLLQNAGQALSVNHILEKIWGPQYQNNVDYVHAYISRLRQKIEVDSKKPRYLLTQHGSGYRFQKLPVPAD